MTNPRRRRTVIVVATLTFVLIMQLPNLLNFLGPCAAATIAAGLFRQPGAGEADRELASGRINVAEFQRRLQEIGDKHVSGRVKQIARCWSRSSRPPCWRTWFFQSAGCRWAPWPRRKETC